MYFSLMILLVITFVSVSHSALIHANNDHMNDVLNRDAASTTSLGSEDLMEADTRHPRYGTVGNY